MPGAARADYRRARTLGLISVRDQARSHRQVVCHKDKLPPPGRRLPLKTVIDAPMPP